MATQYERLRKKLSEIADINNAAAVLGWDQEVYMPPKSSELRSRQLATLSGLAHDLFSSRELGDLLEQVSQSPDLN